MRARSLWGFAALGLGAGLGGCNSPGYPDNNAGYGYVPAYAVNRPVYAEAPFDDPGADYARRSVTISPGAGNAQAANMALQTATPWPRYSQNTNIPGNGAQMTRAIHEFESGTREAETGKRSLQSSSGGGGPALEINNTSSGTPSAPQ